ncbi:serine/threonine protein kinase [Galdieria sulphuraria]|uniref:Serine/threonine protein kinase n=1 Tax=Galdieria sulphuraria TaxID=130081 RepID=M2Y9K4_GALSU|nr:serine/threonine protein kinase [Galdieria sulphuraria]EME32554.1 serine/threonine protein kinase [Galdieria sulphuraria]|eukprot:XP_005709074.1 serine/threonine protein kinase [Galdieria sulphuraria]
MTNLESWEGVKENIQPVSCGRDPDILRKFGTNEKKLLEEDKVLQEKQREWETQLEEALRHPNSLDLAAIWRNYWKWIQQHYPTGHPNSLEFLERATKSLSSDQKYKNNIHALKIWISYADISRDPLPIFEYMYANDIGKEFSLFYEAYALILEKNRKFSESDRIFMEGINRRASPLERLQKRHQEFQHRMVKRMQREEDVKSLSNPGNMQNKTDTSFRQPLNAVDKKPLCAGHGSFTTSKLNSNFEIHQDQEQQENIAPSFFPHVPLMTLHTKENQGTVDIWKGRRLPQKEFLKDRSTSITNSSFEIFEDELTETPGKTDSSTEMQARENLTLGTPLAPSERTRELVRQSTETKNMDKNRQRSQLSEPSQPNVNDDANRSVTQRHFQAQESSKSVVSSVGLRHQEIVSDLGDESQNDNLSDNGDITFDNNLNVSSPTIHTKMALADVEAMFDSTLTFERNLKLYNEDAIPNDDNDTLSFVSSAPSHIHKNSNEAFSIYEDPQ